jgi:hypothetical protein
MSDNRVVACAVVLLAHLGICGDGHCQAAEPQAAFALKHGWVEFALRQDGRPVADAKIQIMDEKGVKFGEGETGAAGETAFPLPPGASFVVEIKAGERIADPIRLFKSAAGVEPVRVLLSYGLRPCCRSIKPRGDMTVAQEQIETKAESNEESIPWHWLAPVFAFVCLDAVVFFLVWRRSGSAPGPASRSER